MTSYNFGLNPRKSKKKQLSDFNFYLKEASSSDSVDTEIIVSCYDDDKLEETFINDSDEDEDVTFVNEEPSASDVTQTYNENTTENTDHQVNDFLASATDVNSTTDSASSYSTIKSVEHSSLKAMSHTEEQHQKQNTDFPVKGEHHNSSCIEQYNNAPQRKSLERSEDIKEGQFTLMGYSSSSNSSSIKTKGDKNELPTIELVDDVKGKVINKTRCDNKQKRLLEDNQSLSTKQVFFTTNQNTTSETEQQKTNTHQKMASTLDDPQNNIVEMLSLTTSNPDFAGMSNVVLTSSNNVIDNDGRSSATDRETTAIVTNTDVDSDNITTVKQQERDKERHFSTSTTAMTCQSINGNFKNNTSFDIMDGDFQQSKSIRADQFNKVCPTSPFDDVPGFRRSVSSTQNRISQKRNKDKVQISPKLSKSVSVDVPKLLQSPVVVGRDKWIRFDHDRIKDIQSEGSTHSLPLESDRRVNSMVLQSRAKASSSGMKDWISFEANPDVTQPHIVKTMEKERDTSEEDRIVDQEFLHVDITDMSTDKERILSSPTEENKENKNGRDEGLLRKDKPYVSTDNLLNVVNKTVSLLRGSITNRGDEEKNLVAAQDTSNQHLEDDVCSELSDEVISLEFDTDEEKLRDTPVKQFPDVSLFQATTAAKEEKSKLNYILNDENFHNDIDVENGVTESIDQYPSEVSRTSWNFWYRYPNKKRKFSSRKWLPVSVNLEGEFLKISGSSKNTSEIVKEIPLHPFYVFTVPVLHKGNKDGKVHSVKLQYVKYKEKRRLKARFGVEHIPIYTPVVKLSSRDVIGLREFIGQVEKIIRHIPTYRDKGITYTHEEIFIDTEDQCQYLTSGDGKILKYNVTVQLRLRVFVTGNPELKLFLNDAKDKEILSRTKEALIQDDRKVANNWITPELYEYHPCVDKNKSNEEGGVVFVPPDGCSFELLRFRIRKRNPLPLIGTSSLEVLAMNSVHLKAEVRVNGDAKSIRHKRTNVVLYIPVPSSWSKLFIKSRNFGKTKNYICVKTNQKSSHPAKASNSRVTLNVSVGSATYEPAYGSIVWKIGTLPIIRDGVPVDASHTFECFIELPFPLHIRDEFQPYSYLEYNISHQMGSDVSVEEILLSDGRVPDKWVCYRSSYMHTMEMKIMEDGKERKSS